MFSGRVRSIIMFKTTTELPQQNRLNERLRPDAPAVMYQRWEELLFLHWRVDPGDVQQRLPQGLLVDTFDGAAWIGVVPFQMRRVRPRWLPAVSGLSNFPELNLRTYVVDAHGRPGVWFYSLDTPQPLANWIARRFFHLNYRRARFDLEQSGAGCRYGSQLRQTGGWDQLQNYHWRRSGQPFAAEPGSLDFFLVERYRLFAYDGQRRQLLSGQVHHVPYPLQQVELSQYSKRLFELNQLPVPAGGPASVLGSAGVDVSVHPLGPVNGLQSRSKGSGGSLPVQTCSCINSVSLSMVQPK